MEEKTNKLSNDWVRCQSKSRPDRSYLFNKKTGETKWCTGNETNNHLKTVAVKTPAQDRLKRLQNQLEKKRFKEAFAETSKPDRLAKKDKKKDSTKANASPTKEINPKGVKIETCSTKESHASSKTSTGTSISSKISSVQKRLIIAAKKSSEKSACEKSKVGEIIPPERNKSPVAVPTVEAPIESEESQPFQEAQRPQIVPIHGKDAPIQYDENKNQRQSEDKGGFLSKIKDFCSNLINKSSKAKYKSIDAEKLSAASKPLFKSKKKCNKDFLRGLSSDVGREVIQSSAQISGRSPDKKPKVVPLNSVPKESANDRLARLRESLKEQQPLHPPPITADIILDNSIPSLNELECEPMDWQPINEDIAKNTTSTTSEFSADLTTVSEHNDTINANITRLIADQVQSKHWKKDHFHFIIDTNVFIEYPTFVEDLTSMKLCDTMGTVIYIPYCVLQELDKLKICSPSETTRVRTTRAIKLLRNAFKEGNPQFQAQSAAEEAKHLIKVTSPDDSILNCCLQVKQHVDNLLLLTEDVNLQNKAVCNDILVSTKSDLISLH